MNELLIFIVLIPFLGTVFGSGLVFFIKNQLPLNTHRMLLGFAAGVMVAASVWSLIIPSIEASEGLGNLSFVPSTVGILFGFVFLLLLDTFTPHMHANGDIEGKDIGLGKQKMMFLAVTLHNIPEGMALGVVLAALLNESSLLSLSSAIALALGIALQNFPEGAIVSLPLKANGMSKTKSFAFGAISGIVEPLATVITLMLSAVIESILPYALSFAAGAMLYVVVEELIPQANEGKHSNIATLFFAFGFVTMMILDVALG